MLKSFKQTKNYGEGIPIDNIESEKRMKILE